MTVADTTRFVIAPDGPAVPAPLTPVWEIGIHMPRRPTRLVAITREWLAANGIRLVDLAGDTAHIVYDMGGRPWLVTWQADRELDGTRVHCPSCQDCYRGHPVNTPLTVAPTADHASFGFAHIDQPRNWLDLLNAAITAAKEN